MSERWDLTWEAFEAAADDTTEGALSSEALLDEGIALRAVLDKSRVDWHEKSLNNGPHYRSRRWVHNYIEEDADATWPKVDTITIQESEYSDTIVLSIEHKTATDDEGNFTTDAFIWGTRQRPSPIRKLTPGKLSSGAIDYYEPVARSISDKDHDDLDELVAGADNFIQAEMGRISAASEDKELVDFYEYLLTGQGSSEVDITFLADIKDRYELSLEQLERALDLCEEKVSQSLE